MMVLAAAYKTIQIELAVFWLSRSTQRPIQETWLCIPSSTSTYHHWGTTQHTAMNPDHRVPKNYFQLWLFSLKVCHFILALNYSKYVEPHPCNTVRAYIIVKRRKTMRIIRVHCIIYIYTCINIIVWQITLNKYLHGNTPKNAHLTVLQQSYATKTPCWIGDHSQCMTSPKATAGVLLAPYGCLAAQMWVETGNSNCSPFDEGILDS